MEARLLYERRHASHRTTSDARNKSCIYRLSLIPCSEGVSSWGRLGECGRPALQALFNHLLQVGHLVGR